MSGYDEDGIPTIIDKQWKPPKPLLKAIIARIQNTEDLFSDLPFMQINDSGRQQKYMEQLAHLIASHLHEIEEKVYTSREKRLATDLGRKTENRWINRPLEDFEREAKIKHFTRMSYS